MAVGSHICPADFGAFRLNLNADALRLWRFVSQQHRQNSAAATQVQNTPDTGRIGEMGQQYGVCAQLKSLTGLLKFRPAGPQFVVHEIRPFWITA